MAQNWDDRLKQINNGFEAKKVKQQILKKENINQIAQNQRPMIKMQTQRVCDSQSVVTIPIEKTEPLQTRRVTATKINENTEH